MNIIRAFALIPFWKGGRKTYHGDRLPRNQVALVILDGFSEFGGVDVIVGDIRLDSVRALELLPGNVTMYFYPRNTTNNASADKTHRTFLAEAGKKYLAKPVTELLGLDDYMARGFRSRLRIDQTTGSLSTVYSLKYQVAIREL